MIKTGLSIREGGWKRFWVSIGLAAICLSPVPLYAWETDADCINEVQLAHWNVINEAQGGKWWHATEEKPYVPALPIYASCLTYYGRPAWGTPALSSDGFGMAGLCIGAYRGWIAEELAYERIHDILEFYLYTAIRADGSQYYNHYYNPDSGLPCTVDGKDQNLENNEYDWTPIDTSWMICGALLAGEYFKGTEVEQMANEIYDTTKLNWYNPWVMPWCEYFIINILGAGSRYYPLAHPHNTSNVCNAADGWYDPYGNNQWREMRFRPHEYCSLFWYQWTQHFLDMRYYEDGYGSNHYELAINFMKKHREECIRLNTMSSSDYPDYGPNSWFITATDGPGPQYGDYHPWNNANGTVMPMAAPGCMSHVPELALDGMKEQFYIGGRFGCFGFINAVNSKVGYYNTGNTVMDVGDGLMGLECYRSGMPWKYFMNHDRVRIGMDLCGFSSTTNIPINDNFDSGSDPNAWGGATAVEGGASCSYVSIDAFNEWVRNKALQMSGTADGDKVRITLNGTDQCYRDLLSFWLRGENGGENFSVGLRDTDGHEYRVSITDYVENGTVSTNWQRVRIPLKFYAVSGNPNTDVRILSLNDLSVRFNTAGTILMDDLAFVDDDRQPDPPPSVGAACIDGTIKVRWEKPENETVVGYHIFRRPLPDGSFTKANTSLVSYVYTYTDTPSKRFDDEDLYEYTVQAIARNEQFSQFASDFEQRYTAKGNHRDLDWGDGRAPNTFGGSDGVWGSAKHQFVRTLAANGETGWVRRCSNMASGSGIWTSLEDQNLKDYYAVSFKIRGASGGEDVRIGFKSSDENETEIKQPINNFITNGQLTTNWCEVRIPFTCFSQVDFSTVDIMSFSSESDDSSVDIDAIRFLPFSVPDRSGCFVEAENPVTYHGGSTDDRKKAASGGYTLGNSWGNSSGHYARYLFETPSPFNEAVLDVVYACAIPDGRSIQVSVDDVICGSIDIQYTEGWGDETNDYALSSINLKPLDAGSHTVELRITNGTASVNLDWLFLRSAPLWFREAEHFDAQSGSKNSDRKAAASGGQVLGNDWAKQADDYAVYSNVILTTDITNALLRIGYAQNTSTGRLLAVYLDDKKMGALACPPTGGWLEHSGESQVSELPLGLLPAGSHTIRLLAETNGSAINLDWLQLSSNRASLQPPDSDSDGITDEQEILFGTNPNQSDSDNDGLADPDELSRIGSGYLTDPLRSDTDNDGMNDLQEALADTNPTDALSFFGIVDLSAPDLLYAGPDLRWKGSTNLTYQVTFTDNLLESGTAYQVLSGQVTYTNGYFEFTDPTAASALTNALRIYRIRKFITE
jgi:hypothetical protein